MLVAAACVVPGLGGRQLWRDEHATWWASTISWHDLGRLIGSIDVVIAPYYAAMHLWIDIAGDSAAMLRLPEALAMAVSAGLVGLLGRRMFAVRTGVLAGLLFAVVPMITRYGQEARPYAFATMFALLATLWLIRALDKPSLRNWTLYGLAIAATGFSHLVAMAVLAGHVWLVFLAKKRGDRIAHYAFMRRGPAGAFHHFSDGGAGHRAERADRLERHHDQGPDPVPGHSVRVLDHRRSGDGPRCGRSHGGRAVLGAACRLGRTAAGPHFPDRQPAAPLPAAVFAVHPPRLDAAGGRRAHPARRQTRSRGPPGDRRAGPERAAGRGRRSRVRLRGVAA